MQSLAKGNRMNMRAGCELGMVVMAALPADQREGEEKAASEKRLQTGNLEVVWTGTVVELEEAKDLDEQWLDRKSTL